MCNNCEASDGNLVAIVIIVIDLHNTNGDNCNCSIAERAGGRERRRCLSHFQGNQEHKTMEKVFGPWNGMMIANHMHCLVSLLFIPSLYSTLFKSEEF